MTGPIGGRWCGILADLFDVQVERKQHASSQLADDLLTVVIRAFLEEAQQQLRQGWIKAYIDQQGELTRPRGRLRLSEQVRRGRAAAYQLHCDFDELTTDNPVNQVVRAALHVSRPRIPLGSRLAVHADQIDLALAEVDKLPPAQARRVRLPHDRLTTRYDRLLLMASWLLRLFSPGVHAGGEECLGLTFDMNRLFQDVVSRALSASIRRHPLRDRLRLTRERPARHLVTDASGTGRFMMMPDLCLWLDGKLVTILDAKWKRLSPEQDEHKAGIVQADLYQLLAYGYTYGCPRLLLIYPGHPGLEDWVRPRFRYAAPTEDGVELGIATFALDGFKSAADRVLAGLLAP